MAEYRAFPVDKDGHVLGRYEFEAPNDATAVQIAEKYVVSRDVEVWQLGRRVCILKCAGPI